MIAPISLTTNQCPSHTAERCALGATAWVMLPFIWEQPLLMQIVFTGLMLIRLLMSLLKLRYSNKWTAIWVLLTVSPVVWWQVGWAWERGSMLAWLLLLVCAKSFENSRQRDWQVLLLLLLLLCGVATVFTNGLWIGGWLIIALIWILSAAALLARPQIGTAWRRVGQAVAVLALPVAIAFWLMPRLAMPLHTVPSAVSAQTGLSDTMQPGSVAEVVERDGYVADAILPINEGIRAQDLYWRAIVMADFDGETWYALTEDPIATAPASLRPSENSKALHYTLVVPNQLTTHNGQAILPLLDYPLPPLPQPLTLQQSGVARIPHQYAGKRNWRLAATRSTWLPDTLTAADHHRYTRLPAGNVRTHQLAAQLRQQVGEDEQALVQTALNYYRQQPFTYTLRPPVMQGANSVDTFLFHHQQGFCEHYAQSFVVLMRAAGLPARIVTGYQGGRYYPQGGFWRLRNRDAHAWAEVWIEEKHAWLRVDPTATATSASTQSSNENNSIHAALPAQEQALLPQENSLWHAYWTEAEFYWQQWVVQYQGEQQQQIWAAGKKWVHTWSWQQWILGGLLLIAFIISIRWLSIRRLNVDGVLQEGFMLLKLAAWQQPQTSLVAKTARETIKALMADETPERKTAATLLAEYETWRYAAALPSPSQLYRWRWQVRRTAAALMREQPLTW